ncbi:MAG: cellobiose phosphorylase [Hyphomicrobiales bacterium]|nr:cellobiose phosphorylase [Hyphomicrobiales bacterium]
MRTWLKRARLLCAAPPPAATKAAEWLLDNDHHITRTLRQIGEDLPPSFYRRLPRLTSAEEAGLPRAFVLAHGLLNASQFQLSLSGAVSFVQAFQEQAVLTIAELWALPTMLRLACLETLVAAFGRLIPELKPPFEPARPILASGALEETECISRSIANLVVLSSIPWNDFFERTSRVDALLRTDPANVYHRMDFATRDRYRKVVEKLARGSERTEPEVADHVLATASAATGDTPLALVGYWLIGAGREQLEAQLGYRPPVTVRWNRWLLKHSRGVYAATLTVVGVGALALPAFYLAAVGANLPAWLLGIAVAGIPASMLGVALVHWIITLLVPPRILPKLDFENGIPPDCATAVVVPVLISDPNDIPPLLDHVEGHRLANSDPSLQFVILSDFPDAAAERMPGDDALVAALIDGLGRLNQRHIQDGHRPFHLLHRPRQYTPSEGAWMGWERKRGKLEQFNDFVTSGDASAFSVIEGEKQALRALRFVVTVDADTTLPAGSVARLAGALAHPLNRAEFDAATGNVAHGYTIIQPRIEVSPEDGQRSLFAELYTGDTAIDIYSRAVSNVYQDLFGTGIFVGKGVYEISSFRQASDDRVPENALLSHDLFEGILGRTALASDIVLYENFAGGYVEYARRWHRWVRGDWQLLPWLARQVPSRSSGRQPNRLSGLDRWKIADNLRRSLIPLALVAFATAGWLVLPGSPFVWTLLTVAAPGAYLFTDLFTGVASGRRRNIIQAAMRELRNHTGRWFLLIAFLASDAVIVLDAILRTLWRLAVTQRHLLQWITSHEVKAQFAERNSRADFWRDLWPAPLLSIGLAIAIWFVRPAAIMPALPLLVLWFASPEIAAFVSRPRRSMVERLDSEARAFLRRLARRTWFFFETFVGPDDNWLPPDNFQEDPHREIAHRTSPTNIGMTYLSSLAALDLGFVGPIDFVTRTRHSLDTLDQLERYRGHFYNWYDTRLLTPLDPRYVSTVDSGNLAVSFVALSKACVEAAQGPALREAMWDGLGDILGLLEQAVEPIIYGNAAEFRTHIATFSLDLVEARGDPGRWRAAAVRLCEDEFARLEEAIATTIAASKAARPHALQEIQIWLERLHHHLIAMRRDIETLFPWLALMETPPPACAELALKAADMLGPTLSVAESGDRRARALDLLTKTKFAGETESRWIADVKVAIQASGPHWDGIQAGLQDIAKRSESFAFEMDFRFLFDSDQRLFHIGYNGSSHQLDHNRYDLLATEARLASYFAIAKHDVPYDHWFHLGRPLIRAAGRPTLASWNGSMFEYLMPTLLIRSIPGTLLGESERAAIDVQRHYAIGKKIPWGISESAFALRGPHEHYGYRAFGVPSLGLRRETSHDLVVTPYATALALARRPGAAVLNLRALESLGLIGHHGFIEAADFTSERVPSDSSYAAVRTYMAHHQGMILAAIGNALTDNALVRRFHADRRMRNVELLLQERVPWEIPPETLLAEPEEEPAPGRAIVARPHAWVPTTTANFPQTHALGNGRLSTWISDAGGGALRWRDHALTRWLPDATRDNHGLWIYVRDQESGAIWSATQQPTGVGPEEAHVVFHPHLAEFDRRDNGIVVRLEVGVAAGDDVEIRRVTVINESNRPHSLQLTSYGEVVLAPPLQDERHPAFSRLFVGSEYVPDLHGLLFERRPRDLAEQPPVLLHRTVSDDPGVSMRSFETDRRRFLGRNGDPQRPCGIVGGLSGTTGWTLDPIMAIQLSLELQPRQQRQLAFLTMVAGSRASVLELARRYTTLASLDWVLADAAANVAREVQGLELSPDLLPEFQKLGSLLLHPHPLLRADPSVIERNRLGQPRLWGLGISGDLPILLIRVADPTDMRFLQALVQAHVYWRRRGIHIDLVVVRTGVSGYQEPLRERITDMLVEAGAQSLLGHKGGIHLIFADQINETEVCLVEAVAGAVLDEARGSLIQQLAGIIEPRLPLPRFAPAGQRPSRPKAPPIARPTDLRFDNGFGGFSPDGREYVIHLEPGQRTPAPWANVLANDKFGCIVTESGGGFSWAVNSGENRLTPWTNDPVADPPSEALYLRDEEDAEIWTATPQPRGADSAYEIRHGAGYTTWRLHAHGLEQELLIFVPPDEPVKVVRLRLRNLHRDARRVTATYYAEWLLGALRSISKPFVVCEFEADWHALLARNPWNPDFADRVAFLTSNRPPHDFTTDREEFIGRDGSLREPAGLMTWGLGRSVRPGSDPCAALQVHLDIGPLETTEVIFVLGQGRNRAHAEQLVRRWQDSDRIDHAFEALNLYWNGQLGAVNVRTPDPAFDLMLNRWLLYQTIASRILARAGFYQAGGAIGFRDQLQDVLAVLWSDPARVRGHILACAARQFEEGDVLHWWHPPADRGVRTHCSDDLLWLVYATIRYVEATGDESILREEVAFLRAPPLSHDEQDRYARFDATEERWSLFEHCERALERGVTRGPHGLPLIGSGDWNDGMDRVGDKGRGESVWLAWFSIAAMEGFARLSRRLARNDLARRWVSRVEELRQSVQKAGWDGEWYLRAYDDDGQLWGSTGSDECKIDSIAQSWSVLAGPDDPGRARTALAAARQKLVRAEDRVIRLLWPPFDRTRRNPGYIKAYPPGIRENGGQYTHAAAWLGLAFAELGDGNEAWRIFDLLNPINHASTPDHAERYRVEPYVIAADIGGVPPHVGRGGWTWYTGSAGWTWRLGIEGILGLRLENGRMVIDPRLPTGWGSFAAEVRGPAGTLDVHVEDPDRIGSGLVEITVDGEPSSDTDVAFPTDGTTRNVHARLRSRNRRERETVIHD